MPSDKKSPVEKTYRDIEREKQYSQAKTGLRKFLEKSAKQHELSLTEPLKNAVLDDVLFQTTNPGRAERIIEHLFEAQSRLASLDDPELRQERIAYAAEHFREPEPEFRLRADACTSALMTNQANANIGSGRQK